MSSLKTLLNYIFYFIIYYDNFFQFPFSCLLHVSVNHFPCSCFSFNIIMQVSIRLSVASLAVCDVCDVCFPGL